MEQPALRCPFCDSLCRASARYCGQCGGALVTVTAPDSPTLPADEPDTRPLTPGTWLTPRYRIERKLGQGGFGTTYLARDESLDRPCVVKQLRVRPAPDSEERGRHLESIHHEAHLLASLNHPGHPHIPDIYDYLPDRLCLVMKYVDGGSLADLLLTEGELAAERVLRYMRDICSALVYMHTHSHEPVLHRDIKPANILVDRRERVWLIDFGLASVAPTRPESGGRHVQSGGTPGYMPPEQWQNQAEPRSDVYALAMTLRNLLTRAAPGSGRVPVHTSGDSTLPSIRQLRPDLPPQIDSLLIRSLAPVAFRPTAAEFLAEIDTLIDLYTVPPPPPSPKLPVNQRFIGRVALLQELTRRFVTAPAMLLYGPPGVGKTALAAALAAQIVPDGWAWWFHCSTQSGDDTLLWSLAGFLARHGYSEPWRQLQTARQSGRVPPPPQHLLALVVQSLRGSAETPALLLVLDDLHLVANQPLAQQTWAELCALAQEGRVLLLATARQLLPLTPQVPAVMLGGLFAAEIQLLLAEQRVDLDAAQAAQLAAATGGNPQLLSLAADLLRNRSGDLAAAISRLAASEHIQHFLLHEVDAGLHADERAVMGALAALLEEGGSRAALEALLKRGAAMPLSTLVERGLLLAEGGGEDRVYSQHPIMRDFYLAQLGRRARRQMHQRAASHYTREEPAPLTAARHHILAENYRDAAALISAPTTVQQLIGQGRAHALEQTLAALPLIELDARQAAAVATARAEVLALLGNYAQARELLRQSFAEGLDLQVTMLPIEMHLYRLRLQASIEELSGDFVRAERHCREGLQLARQGQVAGPSVDLARLYTQLALVLMRRGNLDQAEEACRSGLAALPPRPAAPRERAALLYRHATIAGEGGHYAGAISTLERTLDLARGLSDLVLTAAVLHNLGFYTENRGDRARALAYYQESLALEERTGNLAGQARTLDRIASIALVCGDIATAHQTFEASRKLSEQVGLRESLAWTLGNLGQLTYVQGQLDSARTYLEQARQIHGQMDNPRGVADACYRLGDVALFAGDPIAAHDYASVALAAAQQAQSAAYESCALRVLGEAALAAGDAMTATRHLAAALRLQRHVGDPYDTALILAAAARLAQATGNARQASRRIGRGLSLAQATAIPFLIEQLAAVAVQIGL